MARRNLPPLNSLLAFESAARRGNFTRAGEELSVAQPAVTRHVAKIEDWIGAPVFSRNGNKVELTAEGLALADLATTIFDRLELGVRDISVSDERQLLIGASFGVTHLWLMPRISGMRVAANVTINFTTSDDYRSFDDRAVDVSIRFGNGDFGNNDCDLLFPEMCQIIASPAFLEAHKEFDPANPAETIDQDLMLDHADPYSNGWLTWRDLCRRCGSEMDNGIRLRTVLSYPTMLDMICAGEGMGIGCWGLEDQLVREGRLRRIGQPIGRESYGYYLVYRPETKSKRSFQRLRAYLLENVG